MQPIHQKQDQKDITTSRFDPDLYILSYPQNHINLIAQRKNVSPTLPNKPYKNAQQTYSLANTRKESKQGTGSVADRWKNIDKLVEMLKRGSKSKDKDESACSRLFKLVEKLYARFRRKHSRQIKLAAFKKIKTKAEAPSLKPWMLNLKESLEMRENQIQKGSKNFEINDLMNIINLHHNEVNQNKLQNSLSRQLTLKNAASKEKPLLSPKKTATNVYILRRKTKEDLSTRQDLNSNTHISSQQFLPNVNQAARSISPHSVDRSKSPISVKDEHIELPSARNSAVRDNKLQQLEIDSVKLDKSQSNDQQQRENISNMKLPSFGLSRPSQVAAIRPNRFMNHQAGQIKIVFHYKNNEQRSTSPLRNQYFPPETTAKFMIPRQATPKITQQTPNLIQQNVVNPKILKVDQPVSRLHRISSLQTLHPRSIISNHAEGGINNQNNAQLGRKDDGSVQSRRCYSMPKITFTYKTKEEAFVNPTPHNLHKNSPIFMLNQLKSNASQSKEQIKEDPYLSKNIEVNNVAAPPTRHQLIHPRQLVYAANVPPENYYNMPVNNFAPVNQARTERLKIFSNHQTQPTNSFISNQQVRREQYYGSKQVITTQNTLPSPDRQRFMSTDTYILSRPKLIQQVSLKKQNMAYAMVQRQRARSCGIKMEVVSRKLPMIRLS